MNAEARRERPRVLHVVTASGTTRLMRGQLRFLREAGFDVTIMASPGEGLDMTAAEEGVAKIAVAMAREISPLRDLRSFGRLFREIRGLRPALVNAGTAKAGLLAGFASWLLRVPGRIYTLHGIRLETTRGIKRWILMRTERMASRCAHRVLCVSPSVGERAVELGLAPESKIVVLGAGSFNGINAARFSPTPERLAAAKRLREELQIPQDAPVIGFLGRFTRDKGISELVAAFGALRKNLPDLRLLLLGRFETGDPVPEATRRFIETDPGVVYVGYVRDPSVHYHVMEVLALPTYREGFPTVALEAAAAGKPVVTTHATGARDAVVDGVTGLRVPAGDPVALAEALGRVLTDRELAAKLGAAGRERIEREFRSERVWQSMAEFYRELLEGRV